MHPALRQVARHNICLWKIPAVVPHLFVESFPTSSRSAPPFTALCVNRKLPTKRKRERGEKTLDRSPTLAPWCWRFPPARPTPFDAKERKRVSRNSKKTRFAPLTLLNNLWKHVSRRIRREMWPVFAAAAVRCYTGKKPRRKEKCIGGWLFFKILFYRKRLGLGVKPGKCSNVDSHSAKSWKREKGIDIP